MTVVFAGPSLSPEDIKRALPHARIEPPIARGDLDRLRREGYGDFLLIDGLFAHRLAVAPSEIVAALRDGARVIGAASIGAIRAAECWPAGMQGVGAIYRLYRLKVVSSDDEVAVATDPERNYAAVSHALIDIRYALLAMLRRRLLDRDQAGAVLTAAKRTHFSERRFQNAFKDAGVEFTPPRRNVCESTDIKRSDALRAVAQVAREPAPSAIEPRIPTPGAERYPGHDPCLGYEPAALRTTLTQWLLDTGRHTLYAADPDPDRIWSVLESTGALEPELMRWYATQRISRTLPAAPRRC